MTMSPFLQKVDDCPPKHASFWHKSRVAKKAIQITSKDCHAQDCEASLRLVGTLALLNDIAELFKEPNGYFKMPIKISGSGGPAVS